MVKIVASWNTLMKYAHELGQARLSGDADRITKAKADHTAYADICKKSETVNI